MTRPRPGNTFLMLVFVTSVVVTACGSSPSVSALPQAQREKIAIDLSTLDERGLRGPPNGLRSVSYEFCIPAGERYASEVQRIDPTLELMRGSRGRIGCAPSQVLCVGNTRQRSYVQVLERLAGLDYVGRIVESVFE